MEEESLFLSYIRSMLKKWVGFQAALDEGMGGPYAREKEIWMGTEIEKYFKQYNNVTPDDIEDYIGEMLENEFDTYFEDGSLLEVSKSFCQAYQLASTNPQASIFDEVHKAREAKSAALLRKASPLESHLNPNSSSDASDESSVSQNEGEPVDESLEKLTLNSTDDCEWTVVSRKTHKKK